MSERYNLIISFGDHILFSVQFKQIVDYLSVDCQVSLVLALIARIRT